MPTPSEHPNSTHQNDVDFELLLFTAYQAMQLQTAANKLALAGGPQTRGSSFIARNHAKLIDAILDHEQKLVANRFANGELAALAFEGMVEPDTCALPDALPAPSQLEEDFQCLHLASRNQILLELVKHKAFAYDIDNEGKVIRFVGNFKGGGKIGLPDENR